MQLLAGSGGPDVPGGPQVIELTQEERDAVERVRFISKTRSYRNS
jgi:hypothetical protein